MLLAATSVPSFLQAGEKQPTLSIKNQKIAIDSQWDVIVVGGGPAGCTAATAAAREGAKTLLIEATGQLGGMGTTGMIPAWCPFSDGEKIIYRGLAEKVFRAAKKGVPHEPADKLDWVSINPEQLMTVYDDMVCSSGAKVLFFSRLADVEMASDDTIEAIIVANKNGLTAFKAKVFVDCTGDGDLSVWAGANYFMGNNSDQVQLSTLCFSVANVDSYGYTTNPNLYWENKDSPIHDALKSGKYPLIDQHSCNNLIGPSVVQFNAGHIAMTNSTDPWQISDAMVKGRKVAAEYLRMLKDYQPQVYGNAFIVKTASLLGIRESRRIEGDYLDSRLVGPQELRRRDWPKLLLRGYTHQRLRSQALRTRRVARYPLPDTYPQRHKELADSGTLHLDRRGGFGQFACHAPFAGHRRGRRSGRSIGYQAVQKRCSQYRCRFPAQTTAGRGTIFQIISSVPINLFFH